MVRVAGPLPPLLPVALPPPPPPHALKPAAQTVASQLATATERARTDPPGLFPAAREVRQEHANRRPDQGDDDRYEEGVDGLGVERPHNDPDDQAGCDGEDESHRGEHPTWRPDALPIRPAARRRAARQAGRRRR